MVPYAEDAGRSGRCLLPWILLAVMFLGLLATAWWGYTRREDVARYAVSAMLEQQLGEMLPPGEDPTRVAVRLATFMRAFKDGKVDPEQLKGMGNLLRDYYGDRHLDAAEFRSLLAFAEAAVEP